jgi:hypothetical protein
MYKGVFPQIAYFQNSIEKKEKVREKGFAIARIPSRKKEKVREKGFAIAIIPSRKKKKFVRKASR